jgi:hypothetical protein
MTMTIDQTRPYMTVKSAQLLQEQQVCNFLDQMNQEEILKIQEEPLNTQLTDLDEAYNWVAIATDGIFAAVGLAAIVSPIKYTHDHSSYAKEPCDTKCRESDEKLSGRYPWIRYDEKPPLLSEEELSEKRLQIEKKNEENCTRWDQQRMDAADEETWTWTFRSSVIMGAIAIAADLGFYRLKKYELITGYTTSINNDRHLRLQHRIRQIGEKLKETEDEVEKHQLPIAKDYFSQKFDLMEIERKNKITLTRVYV